MCNGHTVEKCLPLQVVEPKRVALRGAEALLIAANAQLREKQAALKSVEDKVASLEAALAAAQGEQASLKEQAGVTATRLQRAAKLISGLQEEGVRWGNSAQQIKVHCPEKGHREWYYRMVQHCIGF